MPETPPNDPNEPAEDAITETEDDAAAGTDWESDDNPYKAKFQAQRKVNRDLERSRRSAPPPARDGQQQTEPDDGPSEADIRAAEAEVEAVAWKLAARLQSEGLTGAANLLDSVSFRKKLDRLDVDGIDDFEEEAEKLMRAELKKNPPAKTATPPKKQGADMSGGAAGRERPKGISAAIAARYSGSK